MPNIFISYRRDDTSGYAGRLYDQITAHFGDEHVFMDVADIEPGADFVQVLQDKVGTCDALIALIGKNWLTCKNDENRPRLSDPRDFVSAEIAAALKPRVVRGDLRHDFIPLLHEAPKGATLVIFHTAVLAYVPSVADRQNFARKIRTLCPYWISNESPQIFPDIAQRIAERGTKGSFLLSENGTPVAWTDPHGASLKWIADVAST